MKRKAIATLIAIVVTASVLILAGCINKEATIPSPTVKPASTPTVPQLPMPSVQLPREVTSAISGTSSTEFWEKRNASGMLIGIHLRKTETKDCIDRFRYTEVTDIIFRGLGGGEPIEKTVAFTYPPGTAESIPTDRPYPIFSPAEIVTDYTYEHPEKPLPSQYQSSTSYVIIENLGMSGNITVPT